MCSYISIIIISLQYFSVLFKFAFFKTSSQVCNLRDCINFLPPFSVWSAQQISLQRRIIYLQLQAKKFYFSSRLRKEIKREKPKDAKLCSENRQNNAKFPEGMQFPCYPKNLLGSASLKEKNASTLAINCRRRVMVSVKMILIIIFRLLYIIIYHSSNCDWVYWPCYVWKMISLRNQGRKKSKKKTPFLLGTT